MAYLPILVFFRSSIVKFGRNILLKSMYLEKKFNWNIVLL